MLLMLLQKSQLLSGRAVNWMPVLIVPRDAMLLQAFPSGSELGRYKVLVNPVIWCSLIYVFMYLHVCTCVYVYVNACSLGVKRKPTCGFFSYTREARNSSVIPYVFPCIGLAQGLATAALLMTSNSQSGLQPVNTTVTHTPPLCLGLPFFASNTPAS